MSDNVTPIRPGASGTDQEMDGGEAKAITPTTIELPTAVANALAEQQERLFNAHASLWCLEQVVRELAVDDLAPAAMREEPMLRIARAIAAVKDIVEDVGIRIADDEIEERAQLLQEARSS